MQYRFSPKSDDPYTDITLLGGRGHSTSPKLSISSLYNYKQNNQFINNNSHYILTLQGLTCGLIFHPVNGSSCGV